MKVSISHVNTDSSINEFLNPIPLDLCTVTYKVSATKTDQAQQIGRSDLSILVTGTVTCKFACLGIVARMFV